MIFEELSIDDKILKPRISIHVAVNFLIYFIFWMEDYSSWVLKYLRDFSSPPQVNSENILGNDVGLVCF